MKKIFFDTNIYNHITSEQINIVKDAIKNNVIETFTIPQILGELIATLPKNKEKGSDLCKIYNEMLSKIIKQPPDLLADELAYLLTGKKSSIFVSNTFKSGFLTRLTSYKEGALDIGAKEFIKTYEDKKKEHYQHAKQAKERIDHQWNDHKVSQFPTFESFLEHIEKSGDLRQSIKDHLFKLTEKKWINSALLTNINWVAKKIENNLHKLPHITASHKLAPALSYRYHLKKEKAKQGDIEDISMLIAVASLDIYVSNDNGAREFSDLIFPEKTSMCLEDFINYIQSTSIAPA